MYPDDATCPAKLMDVNYGGTEIVPRLRQGDFDGTFFFD